MKEKRVIVALFVLIILSVSPIISSATITGHQTSRPTNVSVFVLPAAPVLQILSPTATAYDEGEYILLDYNAILIDTIWYNLDNGQNHTINQSFYFQASVGTHTLYLYGNQSNGSILSDSVTFTVKRVSTGGRVTIEPEEGEEVEIVLEKAIIELSLKQGEEKQMRLLVKNNEETTVNVVIEDLNLRDLLVGIAPTEFTLNPDQTKEILITFRAKNDTVPNVYLEQILIKAGNSKKEVSFFVEVESKEALFDVKIDIPDDEIIFYPGDTLIANVIFYNLGKQGETEVNIEYLIKSPETNEILFGEKQTLIVGTSASITKAIPIPNDIEAGDYIFYVQAIYENKTASASKWIQIVKLSIIPKPIEKALRRIEKDGPYLAMAIFTLTLMFVGLTLAQLLARKYRLFGLRKSATHYNAIGKKKYYGSGKNRHPHGSEEAARKHGHFKSKTKAGRKKSKNHNAYKIRIKGNLKKINK